MTISPKQDDYGGELDEASVVGQELVVAGGHAPELLQLVEEPLGEVALPVERLVMVAWRFAVGPGRDDSLGSHVAYGIPQVVSVVSLVGDHGTGLEAVQQFVAARDVMALPRPEQQAHRVAQRVGGGVYLGAQAAARAAQPLGIRPPLDRRAPAACWWARTTVLSIISHSRSLSAASTARKPPKTSRSTQR